MTTEGVGIQRFSTVSYEKADAPRIEEQMNLTST